MKSALQRLHNRQLQSNDQFFGFDNLSDLPQKAERGQCQAAAPQRAGPGRVRPGIGGSKTNVLSWRSPCGLASLATGSQTGIEVASRPSDPANKEIG